MSEARVTFDMLGYWHMGTGSGKGYDYDAVVAKTANGLPFIPGRTVKGLLREGVLLLVEATQASAAASDATNRVLNLEVVERLFGHSNAPDESRYDGSPGKLYFSGAVLDPDPSVEVGWDKSLAEYLYAPVASTRIDEHGQAADHTLRRIEVAVPATLTATVTCDDLADQTWIAVLKRAAPLIRMAGSHRHRGFGRVCLTVTGGEP